jgi:hypothetical protein
MKSFAFHVALFFLLIHSPAQSLEDGVPVGLGADFIHAAVETG